MANVVGDVRKMLDPGVCVQMFELLEHQRHVLCNRTEPSTFDLGELDMINRVLASVSNNTAEEWLPILTENGVLRSLIRCLLSDRIMHYAESINHHMADDDDADLPLDTCLSEIGCGEDDDDDEIVDDDACDEDVAELDDLFTEIDDDDILPATIADELSKEVNVDSEAFCEAREFGALAQAVIHLFVHVFHENMDMPHAYLKDMYALME